MISLPVIALMLSTSMAAGPRPTFVFGARTGAGRYLLYRSDGTAAGTALLRSFCGLGFGAAALEGRRIYFSADDCTHGDEPWSTDGTLAGTTLVADMVPGQGSSNPYGFEALGSSVFFFAEVGAPPVSLWKFDEGRGVAEVPGIPRYDRDEEPCTLFAWKGALYWWTQTALDERPSAHLWRSDGTASGTARVGSWPIHASCDFVPFRDALFFGASPARGGEAKDLSSMARLIFRSTPRPQLWRTDGTSRGTAPVVRFDQAVLSGVTATEGALFFRKLSSAGDELWRTDGAPEGAVLVRSLARYADQDDWDQDQYVSAIGSGRLLYFNAYGSGTNFTPDIWRSDGTAQGTVRIRRVSRAEDTVLTQFLWESGGQAYFLVDGDTEVAHGYEPSLDGDAPRVGLWRTDATPEGTVLVRMLTGRSPAPRPRQTSPR